MEVVWLLESIRIEFFFNLLFFYWSIVDLQCHVSFRSIYIMLYMYIYILFQIIFPCKLLQNIEYSSLCYIVGPCWLSILYIYFTSP